MEIEKIIYKNINEIIPYHNNPRFNDEAVAAVAASIDNFGFKVPIIIDENNEIIAGHTRLKAAEELGMEKVPTIIAADLTEDQIKAFRIADNKVAELAEWDIEKLTAELETIEMDMDQFGLDDMDGLLMPEVEEDDIEEQEHEEPTAKTGDVYRLGDHVLICGDATDANTMRKLVEIGGAEVDLYLTDPPYNVAVNDDDIESLKIRKRRTDGLKIQNDNMNDVDFVEFLKKSFVAAGTIMKPGAAFYIWHADSQGFNFRTACEETGWQIRQCLIWAKNRMVMGRQDYHWQHEPCLYGWKDGAAHYFTEDRTLTTIIDERPNLKAMTKDELIEHIKELRESQGPATIIDEDRPGRSAEHPTSKPIKLISRLIFNSSRKGDVVLDNFGGSGSTLIACEQLDRKCYMTELDPHYTDVIINRWEEFTGRKAEKIN